MRNEFTAVVERDQKWFIAYCPEVPGANGQGVNDLSAWLTDFSTLGNPAFGRSDYDCSGSVGINDLSVWLTVYGSGLQAQSCSGTCP